MELLAPLFVLALLVTLLVLFASERYPPEVTAVLGVGTLLATGILDTTNLLDSFSNSAPVAIAALFVLSGALERTGLLASVTGLLRSTADNHPLLVLPMLLLVTMGASAFVNNTPVVMVMIPVVMALAQHMQRSASRFLIPLSYAAILGGTCTLVGTSTNLLVDGVARSYGMEPFGVFEISAVGVPVAIAGGLLIWLLGPRLLPDRSTVASLLEGSSRYRYLIDAVIRPTSVLVGKSPEELTYFRDRSLAVFDVIRDDRSQRHLLPGLALAAGDRLVLESSTAELLSLKAEPDLDLGTEGDLAAFGERRAIILEAWVSPGSDLIGTPIRDLRLRRRFGAYILGIHRHGEQLDSRVGRAVLAPGDTILVEGTADDLDRMSREMELVNLTEPQGRAYRRRKAWIALLTLAMVVTLAALDVMSIAGLGVIGVGVVLATRCLDADEAFDAVNWRILVLILAMLAFGTALEESGALHLIVNATAPWATSLPPWAVLALLYALTAALTETITNNAVAIVMAPIALALGSSLGIEPRPLLITVMLAASASFATPIGYQTNTLVYGAGGYRFTDFLRLGLPLNILVGTLTVLLVPRIWPLTA